jgi:hypothetical protein
MNANNVLMNKLSKMGINDLETARKMVEHYIKTGKLPAPWWIPESGGYQDRLNR